MSFTETEILKKLNEFKGWNYDGKCIAKEFDFLDFTCAISFVIKIGFVSEKLNHHPDIKFAFMEQS